jgi:hypothetical protein
LVGQILVVKPDRQHGERVHSFVETAKFVAFETLKRPSEMRLPTSADQLTAVQIGAIRRDL